MKYGFECEYWCIENFCENVGPHGFEYRSLPCNVDPFDVAKVILEMK